MDHCLVVQPIHEIGLRKLEEFGIEPRMASAPDMDTVAREIGGAIACISRDAGLNRKAMEAAENLLVFGNHGIGVDPVDVEYANEVGMPRPGAGDLPSAARRRVFVGLWRHHVLPVLPIAIPDQHCDW